MKRGRVFITLQEVRAERHLLVLLGTAVGALWWLYGELQAEVTSGVAGLSGARRSLRFPRLQTRDISRLRSAQCMMESPREEEDDETEWQSREATAGAAPQSSAPAPRLIVHLDMDCFYAQVEMIRNPALRERPLGVQQKNIIVTCNYVARGFGVGKCMSVRDAKERCPQLVLVSGEDLTHYREMSYRVTDLLEEFSPQVERLGFDENFIDITELVDKRLRDPQGDRAMEASGHVYNDQDPSDWTHQRYIVGSRVAADIRAAVLSRLGMTGCAGVASNKLLSKLVSGTFKPNQQTSCGHLISGLNRVHKIPGIGHKTAQRLEALGLSSVISLQSCPVSQSFRRSWEPRLLIVSRRSAEERTVHRSHHLDLRSEEDSFKKCCSVSDVRTKLEELLRLLLHRIGLCHCCPHADGAAP
ncbi:unnamed protein product [Ranitomeya imitator]|uniref:UmuC domain-containing protein n=1 Tax=Ranitomeya imitator TaxID=111125 RepID=A0ABN9KZ10_9NEOB|nr:unnamed protein product [Ranitomeya imitator]